MSPCEREDELTEVIRDGRWPSLGDSELARHARSCAACTDVVIVATAIVEDQQRAVKAASVAAPGTAWWRVQRRAAAETMRAANRTVVAVQTLSCLAALTIALTLVGSTGQWRSWLQALVRYVTFDGVQLANVAPLALALVTCVTLAPVAIYVALQRD
ncbi:MAG TPA: hypothetical protein VF111_00515 [Thermoanaerobaculia bacterium]